MEYASSFIFCTFYEKSFKSIITRNTLFYVREISNKTHKLVILIILVVLALIKYTLRYQQFWNNRYLCYRLINFLRNKYSSKHRNFVISQQFYRQTRRIFRHRFDDANTRLVPQPELIARLTAKSHGSRERDRRRKRSEKERKALDTKLLRALGIQLRCEDSFERQFRFIELS